MSDTGAVIGDIAQGALTARALEPQHGEAGDDGHTHESACLNCGTALVGSHCHSCGQAAHVHKTISAFLHDLAHGVFHFEGKIWRTLPLLAWNPGRLTREYIDGRRASYVSPIALFLFSVFLMFAVIKQFGGSLDGLADMKVTGDTAAAMKAANQELVELKQRRSKLAVGDKSANELDQEIANTEKAITIMNGIGQGGPENDKAPHVYSDVPAVQHAIEKLKGNPGLALYKLQSNAYKYSWALIPISVPFVWLLFAFRRRFHLYDHTVFVTYSLCFMTLLSVVLMITGAAGAGWVAIAATLVPPWHIYRQLRGTYDLGRFSAIWRTMALLFIALTAMILFTMLILVESGS